MHLFQEECFFNCDISYCAQHSSQINATIAHLQQSGQIVTLILSLIESGEINKEISELIEPLILENPDSFDIGKIFVTIPGLI